MKPGQLRLIYPRARYLAPNCFNVVLHCGQLIHYCRNANRGYYWEKEVSLGNKFLLFIFTFFKERNSWSENANIVLTHTLHFAVTSKMQVTFGLVCVCTFEDLIDSHLLLWGQHWKLGIVTSKWKTKSFITPIQRRFNVALLTSIDRRRRRPF